MRLWGIWCFFLLALPLEAKVLVAYPVVENAEHRRFYIDMISGLSERLDRFGVETLPIDDNTRPQDLLGKAEEIRLDGMILLGVNGLRLAQALEGTAKVPIIVGSTTVSPDSTPGISGVSIFTRLEPLLDFTRRLLPKHKTLVYVEDPAEKWYIETVREQARRFSFGIDQHLATSIPESAKTFFGLFPALKNTQEKILLVPMGIQAMQPELYYEVAMRCFEYRVPIISNIFRYAWTGVLVGTYPDPVPYGRQIADMFLARIRAGKNWTPKVEWAREVKIAYNGRLGEWLGITLPAPMRAEVSRILEW